MAPATEAEEEATATALSDGECHPQLALLALQERGIIAILPAVWQSQRIRSGQPTWSDDHTAPFLDVLAARAAAAAAAVAEPAPKGKPKPQTEK